MESRQIILPIDPPRSEDARLTWNGKLFSVKGALCLDGRPESVDELQGLLQQATVVLKLTPFKAEFRSKMLSMLGSGNEEARPDVEIWGLVLTADLLAGKLGVHEIRRTHQPAEKSAPQADDAQGTDDTAFLPDEFRRTSVGSKVGEGGAESALGETQDTSSQLMSTLVTAALEYVQSKCGEFMRQPFVAFFPALSDSWKTRPIEGKSENLVPFQALFPYAIPMEKEIDGEVYVLDDLYCAKPGCPCTEVTCIILKQDFKNNVETAWGGFKYNTATQKLKALPEFPGKFNTSEWFKRFSKDYPLPLDLVLKARFEFMRGDFIKERAKKVQLKTKPT